MKQFNLLLFIFLMGCFTSCTDKRANLPPDSSFLSPEYVALATQDKIAYLDSLTVCCVPKVNDTLTRNILFKISSEYFNLAENEKSLKINNKLLSLSIQAGDTLAMAKSYYYKADNFGFSRKDSAYYYYLQAEKFYNYLDDAEQTALMRFNKAVLLFYEGNHVESEIELSNALKVLGSRGEKKLLFACYNLMGSNFEKLEDYENAMKYYVLAEEILAELASENQVIDERNNYAVASAVNIAYVFERTGQYQKAIEKLENLITPELKKTWPKAYAVAVGNLAYAKMKKGDLTNVENLLLQSLDVSRKHDKENALIYKLNNLGEYYALKGDTLKSVRYLRQSLDISERTSAGEEIKNILKLLSRMDPDRDAVYKEKYIRYTDSMYKNQRENRNKYARIEYETARVEHQNKLLTTTNLTIIFSSVLVIFLLLSLLIYRYISSQKRELEFKRQQQIADEELFLLLKEHQFQVTLARQHEQNRISKELHDGIMNRIYGVRLHLDMLNDLDDPESKAKRLKFVDILQEIEKEVRLISHDLQIDILQNESDYISLINDFIAQQNGISRTKFVFTHDPRIAWDDISGLKKITIKRTLQEAILNVNKYADALNCRVNIAQNDSELLVSITDDGKGFDTLTQRGGIGIKNLRSRAKSVHGRLIIDSKIGFGTTIELRMPIS
ncbi:MAG: ATP-binding protein [Flavobacterium sp.]|nr:ATP-binding protein [Flavobacterium sp.]